MKRFLALVLIILTGCSLVTKGDFEKDLERDNKIHRAQYEKWMQKKGITEDSLIGLTKAEVRAKLGRPSGVWDDWNRGSCPDRIKRREYIGDDCKGQEWVYTNWYGIPWLSSGFATYGVWFDKDGIVRRFNGLSEL